MRTILNLYTKPLSSFKHSNDLESKKENAIGKKSARRESDEEEEKFEEKATNCSDGIFCLPPDVEEIGRKTLWLSIIAIMRMLNTTRIAIEYKMTAM